MARVLNDNQQVNAPKDIDNKKGRFLAGQWRPYLSVLEANQTILEAYRYKTLSVWIAAEGATPVEYCYLNGIADTDLVPKQAEGTYATLAGSPTDNPALVNFIDSLLANLVDAAPAALDTLNELAAALGNDPNFATTITNAIAGKVSTSSIVNALNSTLTTAPLSAAQGKALKDLIDSLGNVYEPKISSKGTAFNKNFGRIEGTVMEGNAFTGDNQWAGAQEFQNNVEFQAAANFYQVPRVQNKLLSELYEPRTTTPKGIYFNTQPAATPAVTAITGGSRYAETAAAIYNGSATVAIPAKNIDVLNASTGKKRIDLIVARYASGTAGYELVPGPEVDSAGTAIEPSVPAGTLKVRQVNVGSASQTAPPPSADLTQLEARVAANELNKLDKGTAAADGDYAPADTDNTNGFWKGLLTNGKLRLKPALDWLSNKIIELRPSTAQALSGSTMTFAVGSLGYEPSADVNPTAGANFSVTFTGAFHGQEIHLYITGNGYSFIVPAAANHMAVNTNGLKSIATIQGELTFIIVKVRNGNYYYFTN